MNASKEHAGDLVSVRVSVSVRARARVRVRVRVGARVRPPRRCSPGPA